MGESDRHFLGLTHNPFVEPQKGFLSEAAASSNSSSYAI